MRARPVGPSSPAQAGQSWPAPKRETGTDRKTVQRYTAVAKELALPRDRELTEAEVHEVARRVQARPVRAASTEWTAVGQHQERIAEWLGRPRPLKLSKIHTLLVRDHAVEVSYDTLRRYAMQKLGWRKKAATIRLEDP